jgi:hypothetical protein
MQVYVPLLLDALYLPMFPCFLLYAYSLTPCSSVCGAFFNPVSLCFLEYIRVDPKDGGTVCLQNVGIYLPSYVVLPSSLHTNFHNLISQERNEITDVLRILNEATEIRNLKLCCSFFSLKLPYLPKCKMILI